MSYELICTWLELPADAWPPDHYRLLGLSPGEKNPNLIEERVHQRLDAVRRYQMTHADLATEAMNRIAQAFVCLTEPASKRVYDAGLLGIPIAAEEPAAAVAEDREPLVLVYNPEGQELAPPVQRAAEVPVPEAEAIPVAEVAIPMAEAAVPVVEVIEPIVVLHGAAAKRQLYQRIVQTRALIDQWNQAGKFLATSTKRIARSSELNELIRSLQDIRAKLDKFPPVLGRSGQPGHLVVALAQLGSMPMFQMLTPSQREALSRDWEDGLKVLLSQRDYHRDEVRALRKRSLAQRLTRKARDFIVEKPGFILVLIAIVAINVAIWRTYIRG